MYLDPNTGGTIFVVMFFIGLILLGLLIFAVATGIRKGNEESRRAELAMHQLLSNLPQDRQMMFMMQYNSVRKNTTSAILLDLFLGGIGAHRFYLGQVGLGIAYLLFCWTGIPGLVALIDLFLLPGQVAAYNRQKAQELAVTMGTGAVPAPAF